MEILLFKFPLEPTMLSIWTSCKLPTNIIFLAFSGKAPVSIVSNSFFPFRNPYTILLLRLYVGKIIFNFFISFIKSTQNKLKIHDKKTNISIWFMESPKSVLVHREQKNNLTSCLSLVSEFVHMHFIFFIWP